MGLLDQIFGAQGSDQSQAMGLLGAMLMQGRGPEGLLAAQQFMAGAKERELRQGLLAAQLAENQAQAEERKTNTAAKQAEMARQSEIGKALPGLLRQPGFSGGEAVFPEVGGVPMFGQSPGVTPMQATPGGFDVQRALSLRMKPEEIAAYAGLANLGRPEVARTVEVDDGKGGKATRQIDKYGNTVGGDLPGYVPPVQLDLGGTKTFARPVAGISFPVTMDPAQRDASARGWAGHGLAQQRFNFDKSQADAGKWQYDAERGVQVNMQTGESRPVMQGGQPLGPKNKELTDAQAKANLFGTRAGQSNAILSKLAAGGTELPGILKQAAEGVPLVGGALGSGVNALPGFMGGPNAQQQQVEQAQRDFVNAVLRRESGAVISPSEFDNAKKQYFPQVGDSEEVKLQKAKNRELAIAGIMAEVPDRFRQQQPKPQPVAQPGQLGSGSAFPDPAKESRYQAWKRSQGLGQ